MAEISTRSQRASRRPAPRRASRRRRTNWRGRAIAFSAFIFLIWIGWAVLARLLAPHENAHLQRYDAIIVLGSPTDGDGNPTPTQLSRVTEAVREYERGIAPRIIMSGAAVRNQFVEAQVMAQTAKAQGVPPAAVILETNARDTIQNACYSARLATSRGWNSAEVISDPIYLPRAAMIFSRVPLQWSMHAAPALQPQSSVKVTATNALEVVKTMRYLVWARWREQCEP